MTLHSLAPEAAAPFPTMHLVEELNHRVVNEYAEAILSLSMAAQGARGPAREALAWATSRLTAHVETHRALQPPDEGEVVDLGDYIARLCASLSKATLADSGVRIMLKTDDIRLDATRGWRIGLIVAELVRNAARHGLAGGAGAVGVRLVERSGCITCTVCDSGAREPEFTPGRGLPLVRLIVAELGGTVDWWFSAAGSVASVRIPAIAAAV